MGRLSEERWKTLIAFLLGLYFISIGRCLYMFMITLNASLLLLGIDSTEQLRHRVLYRFLKIE